MSEMTCQELVELVTAFLDGALDADTERRFIDHLSSCDGCARYLDQFEETIATVGGLQEECLSTDLRDDLMTAFRDFTATEPTGERPGERPDDHER
jgi:anti-sigma factor RsiW